MTPVVMKLIEEAVREGHISAMKSATPAHTNTSDVSLSKETLEMRFVDLVKERSFKILKHYQAFSPCPKSFNLKLFESNNI